jgi:anaerobic magnesium-protoporphyrin IX monomethyl ester cyclase
MKFLFIYPPPEPFFIRTTPVFYGLSPPLGLLYLARILEDHADIVQVLDFSAEPFNENLLLSALKDVDAVGLTVLTTSLQQTCDLIHRIKKESPGTPVVIGGPHCTLQPEKALEETGADFCVQGDGESAILDIKAILRQQTTITKTSGVFSRTKDGITHGHSPPCASDLDSVPFPARHLSKNYVYGRSYNPRAGAGEFTSMITSRGCPYHCRFCSRGSISMQKYRTRSVDNILGELREIQSQGYRHVSFVDDCFPVNVGHTLELFESIIKDHISLKFSVTATRVDLMDEELYRTMKRAGVVQVQFGLESGNQDVLDFYNKHTTVDMIKKAVHASHETGFFTTGSFILGAPFETKEHFKRTVALAKSLPLDSVSFLPLRYMIGSDLWDQAVKDGHINPDEYLVIADSARGLGRYSKEELLRYCAAAQRAYYLRPVFFIHLLQTSLRNNDMSLLESYLSVLSSGYAHRLGKVKR